MKYNFINNSEFKDNILLIPFTENVLKRSNIKTETITIDDWDLDRIYLTIDGKEYTIRTWNIWETEKMVNFEWSLITWLNGESSGTTLTRGYSRFRKSDYKDKQ